MAKGKYKGEPEKAASEPTEIADDEASGVIIATRNDFRKWHDLFETVTPFEDRDARLYPPVEQKGVLKRQWGYAWRLYHAGKTLSEVCSNDYVNGIDRPAKDADYTAKLVKLGRELETVRLDIVSLRTTYHAQIRKLRSIGSELLAMAEGTRL